MYRRETGVKGAPGFLSEFSEFERKGKPGSMDELREMLNNILSDQLYQLILSNPRKKRRGV